ncbi:MAG: hypothetical protein PHS30_04670 [Bacteroidales bacterium]|nr:hypothetical protein [Bacteroidales bacterium]
MEQLSNVIASVFSGCPDSAIQRVFYTPYDIDVALKVWLKILERLTGKPAINDPDKEPVYKALIRYIHGDPESSFELQKGVALTGPVGTGKTVAMKVMKLYIAIDNVRYLRNGKPVPLDFHIFNSREIVAGYSEGGFDGIDKYCYYANICIDDLGTEIELAKYYGTALNVIEEVIEQRYLKNKLTHISTNLSMLQINDKYGARVYSRLKEMTTIQSLTGKDMRK